MIYRATARITWPDGSVRAEAGQHFEGYDEHENPAVRQTTRGWLRGQWTSCAPAPGEEPDAVGNAIPEDFKARLSEAAATPIMKILEERPERSSDPSDRVLDRDLRRAQLGDPEE